jgi:hypothetical protein
MFMPSAKSFAAARNLLPVTLSGLPFAFGLVAGSLVETPQGWTPVETLCQGAQVLTYDGGAQPVAAIRRITPDHAAWEGQGGGLVRAPGGALNNCGALMLLPEQPVLIHSEAAEAVLGTCAVLVRAAALTGFRGIHRVAPEAPVGLVALEFARDEMVFVNSGALLHCPSRAAPVRPPAPDTLVDGFFPMLDAVQARALLDLIETDALSTADLAQAA